MTIVKFPDTDERFIKKVENITPAIDNAIDNLMTELITMGYDVGNINCFPHYNKIVEDVFQMVLVSTGDLDIKE